MKNSNSSIAEFLDRINDESSLAVGRDLESLERFNLSVPVIVMGTFVYFVYLFIVKMYFCNGVRGYRDAVLESLSFFSFRIKMWEYVRKKQEGKEPLPPVKNAEVERLKQLY